MHANAWNTWGSGIPPERMKFSRLSPSPRLALLATVGECHGPGPCREAEADLTAGAEKCVHLSQNGCGLKEFLPTRQCRGKARHAAGLGSLANAGTLGHLLSALTAPALRGELSGARADLPQVLLVWRHGGNGGSLRRLLLSPKRIEAVVTQLTKRIGFDPVTERGKLHPCALYSQAAPASRRVRVHLLYDARSRHRTEGGTARGSGSP
jgi:hypothetical protein